MKVQIFTIYTENLFRTNSMRKLLFVPILLFLFSCGSDNSPAYMTEIWIGSTATADELNVGDVQKEIQAKLDVLNLIAEDSFKDYTSYSIDNHDQTSTFLITVTGNDTSAVKESMNVYLGIVQGAYNVRIIKEPHRVEKQNAE